MYKIWFFSYAIFEELKRDAQICGEEKLGRISELSLAIFGYSPLWQGLDDELGRTLHLAQEAGLDNIRQ